MPIEFTHRRRHRREPRNLVGAAAAPDKPDAHCAARRPSCHAFPYPTLRPRSTATLECGPARLQASDSFVAATELARRHLPSSLTNVGHLERPLGASRKGTGVRAVTVFPSLRNSLMMPLCRSAALMRLRLACTALIAPWRTTLAMAPPDNSSASARPAI